MAYPTQGIGEAAVGSGMAGIQFMLAVQMELLKGISGSEPRPDVRSEIVVQACREVVQASAARAHWRPGARSLYCFLFAMMGSRRVDLPVAIVSIGREGQPQGRAS